MKENNKSHRYGLKYKVALSMNGHLIFNPILLNVIYKLILK